MPMDATGPKAGPKPIVKKQNAARNADGIDTASLALMPHFWSGGLTNGNVPNMFLVWLCICSCICTNRFLLCSM